ncbi:MAG: hypothetical protein A2X12_06200 [Bacteroidetes bacterium GWE2_29_8]|nr:MAG: hypothetical protein A2X12_06200 [Bacteroidetes bacterium GWE2_29_8]
MFNDTIYYFLTWNSSFNNKRFNVYSDNNISGYTNIPYLSKTNIKKYNSTYYYGATDHTGSTNPEYSQGEGWFDNYFELGQSVTKSIETNSVYYGGPEALIKTYVIGESNNSYMTPDHHLQIKIGNYTKDTLYEGYSVNKFVFLISNFTLGSQTTNINFSSINDIGTTVDRNTISYIQITYPHTIDLNAKSEYSFHLPIFKNYIINDKVLCKLSNISSICTSCSDTLILYDLDANSRVKMYASGGSFYGLIPVNKQDSLHLCFVSSLHQQNAISKLLPVNSSGYFYNFKSSESLNSNYLIVTSKALYNESQNYRDYRNSKGYRALLIDIDELYNQFAYGVNKHPLALRNFCDFAIGNFTMKPENLFIIGKAYYPEWYKVNRQNSYSLTHVPSFGTPPSDVLITAGLKGNQKYTPAIPTGRLAAKDATDIRNYLSKVVQYENNQKEPAEWHKRVLHFGGGSDIYEQNKLASYLNEYKQIVEDTLLGGKVYTFLKKTTAPFEFNLSDSLKNLINNGVSMLTFFGHAAGIGFDVSLDNPSEYDNTGKYFFILANSCYAGDIFGNAGLGTQRSSSEEFVLIPNKGGIAYISTISKSTPTPLHIYSKTFHEKIFRQNYGSSIGLCIKNTLDEIYTENIYVKWTMLEMTLHGDPALKFNSHLSPDYVVNNNGVSFFPIAPIAEDDSFSVKIICTNIGMAINDSFYVSMDRTFPDGTTESFLKYLPSVKYKDSIEFKIPMVKQKAIGLNKIKIYIDAFNQIEEYSELNNIAEVAFYISTNDVMPVYPAEYSVIPTDKVTLIASTGDPLSKTKSYVFQLDTSDEFLNPLTSQVFTQEGGIIQWTPNVTFKDSNVYFWRVGIVDNTNNNYFNWRESSFRYINSQNGWSQAHFDQFKKDNFNFINYDKSNRLFEFIDDYISISAVTGVDIDWIEEKVKLNGAVLGASSCLGNYGGLKFVVINPETGAPWISYRVDPNQPIGPYGNWHCQTYSVAAFDFFTQDKGNRDLVKNFINQIPEGYYVLAMSHKNDYAESFEEELYQAFESIGSNNIRTLKDNRAYIIFGIKGSNKGDALEQLGTTLEEEVSISTSFSLKWKDGKIKSTIIGPSKKWGSLHWRYLQTETPSADIVTLTLLGYKNINECDTLISTITKDSLDIYMLDQIIDAKTYPFIQLIASKSDDSLHTAPQLKQWTIIYDGIPETALDKNAHYYFYKDTVNEGDDIKLSFAIHNISKYDMDSLLIKYWIVDQYNNKYNINYPRQKKHLAGDIFIDTISYNTKNLNGLNHIWIDVNPDNDQLEQHHFNNIAYIPFFVTKDITNPLLDITFDGIHILNGDIVSAKTNIEIKLKDENKYLLMDDTSAFKIFLKYPDQDDFKRIYFVQSSDGNLIFYPASSNNNSCRIEFTPKLSDDGTYQLMVQAKDKSNNNSGDNTYTIAFKVVHKSTITNIMNWPNPFSTSTKFVFTLTGSVIPDDFKIQIFTITGKLVKEISKEEIGNINIGRNITQYAWDGTDNYGNKLANGVYLYKTFTRINKQNIEKTDNQTDKFFKNDIGKLYIMR